MAERNSMRFVAVTRPGGPAVMQLEQGPVPEPAAGEVLIAVAAAGVNRPDLMQRAGSYPPPPGASPVLGLEVAGHIAKVGEGVTAWREGDAVCALTNGGGYAEFVSVPAGQCLPVPQGFSFAQAAALPETFFTVWANVFDRAGLQPGETLLVHGGSGGIGTAAIQMAKAWGAQVIATAGTAEKCRVCDMLGADLAINYHAQDFVQAVKTFTGDAGANVILDMVGGDYVERNLSAAAVEGRIVNIAFQRGSRVTADLIKLMLKRLTLTGSTLRARSSAYKATVAAELYQHMWPKLASGSVAPLLHATLPLADVVHAHQQLESGQVMGKLVLTVDERQ